MVERCVSDMELFRADTSHAARAVFFTLALKNAITTCSASALVRDDVRLLATSREDFHSGKHPPRGFRRQAQRCQHMPTVQPGPRMPISAWAHLRGPFSNICGRLQAFDMRTVMTTPSGISTSHEGEGNAQGSDCRQDMPSHGL